MEQCPTSGQKLVKILSFDKPSATRTLVISYIIRTFIEDQQGSTEDNIYHKEIGWVLILNDNHQTMWKECTRRTNF